MRCMVSIFWFGMTIGIYDGLDVCREEDKSGHIPATVCYHIPGEAGTFLACRADNVRDHQILMWEMDQNRNRSEND